MFREELERKVNSSMGDSLEYVVTMLSNNAVIVEGHHGIRSYSRECIRLRVSKTYISIVGDNLSIKEINDVDVWIVGNIVRIGYDE